MIEIPVPMELLNAANTVSVTFPDTGGRVSSMILAVEAVEATQVAGDFDGDTDSSDFLTGQNGFATTYDTNDLTDWQQNNGKVAPIAVLSSVAAATSLPQPSQPGFPEVIDGESVDANLAAAASAWDLASSLGESEDKVAEAYAPLNEAFDSIATVSASIVPVATDVGEDFAVAGTNKETNDIQWLADDLLEKVFG